MEEGIAVPKETVEQTKARAKKVYDRLHKAYPDAKTALDHHNDLQLLIATILSAQCTDARVNLVTPALFKRFKTAQDFVAASQPEVEKYIKSCGFYHSKAKNIRGTATKIVEEHGGKVPDTLEKLVELPGVGRKTANVLLGTIHNVPGVIVDTHCGRLGRRLGFTRQTDPVKVERDLMKLWPREIWSRFSHLLVFHGRSTCFARSPKCSECVVRELCPFAETSEGKKICK